MPQIKGASQLIRKARELQSLASRIEEELMRKRRWLDQQKQAYQESLKGQEWAEYLDHLDDLVSDIINIRPDRF